jgi:hypothetical protein
MADIADEATMELIRQQMGLVAGAPNRITAKFSVEAVHDLEASEKAGKPIYVDTEFVTKWIPGDKDNVVHRPVRLVDKAEFSEQYRAFKLNQDQPQTGTPLEMLAFLSPANRAELGYYGIRTAEQLMTMADVNGQNIMGFQQLKNKTKVYLDALAGAAPAQKLQAELSKRDDEIALLKTMVETLGAKVDEQNKASKGYIKHEKPQ